MPDEPTLVPIGELRLVFPASTAFPCDVCGAPSRFSLHAPRDEPADDDGLTFLCDEDFADQLTAAEEVLEQGAQWLRQMASPRVPGQRAPGTH